MLYVHFTENKEAFEDGLKKSDKALYGDGILVYKMTDTQDVEEKEIKWNRLPIYLECDEQFVELDQSDPLGEDENWDEYFISSHYFDKVTVK